MRADLAAAKHMALATSILMPKFLEWLGRNLRSRPTLLGRLQGLATHSTHHHGMLLGVAET